MVLVGSSSNNSLSANSYGTLPLDSVQKDGRSEFDSTNYEFVPEETGWYFIGIWGTYSIGADQDRLRLRLRNTSKGNNVFGKSLAASGTSWQHVSRTSIEKLYAGDRYVLEGANVDSSTNMGGELFVRKAFD